MGHQIQRETFYTQTVVASAMIIASDPDRGMTVREWDPVHPD